MKTSNKLLIAFAAALILLPILGMVYASQALYTDRKTSKDVAINDESFSATSGNMASIALTPFQTVNIADGKGFYFSVRLIKDAKYGVKIPEVYKDAIKLNVDAQGQLQVELTNKNEGNTYITLLVYAPDTKGINLVGAEGLELNAKADSLSINLKKTGRLAFNSEMRIGKLNVATEDVSTFSIEKEIAKSLYLNLSNTNFTSEWASYDDLSIATSGNSTIMVKGDEREVKEYSIQNLTLNTADIAKVGFEGMTIRNCKGSLSDQTQVQMPAVNLRQLFK